MIKSLTLQSYKGFSNTTVQFHDITCIIGENSTGKSTIIEAIRDILTQNSLIPQNNCKIGIPDNNKTSLSLTLQNGKVLSKNIQKVQRENHNSLLQCITSITPIRESYPIDIKEDEHYDQPIKNHNITDIAWKNILSDCNVTLRTAANLTTSISSAKRFNNQHLLEISQKFTKTFNNMIKDSNRQYEFEIFFEKNGNQLIVQLLNSYKMKNNETDKESPQTDLNNESEGFRTLITLSSYFFNEQDKREKIFIMDEPFTNIHPKAQREVSRMLQSLSQKFQIIYATHCPHLLPERDDVICTVTTDAGDLSINQYKDYPHNLFYDLSPLALDTVEEIKRNNASINVCVEGKTDEKIYSKLFQIKEISDKIHITKTKGSSNFPEYMKAFASIDKPSLFILDPNTDTKNPKGLNQLESEHDNIFLLRLQPIKSNYIKDGIENLIPNYIIEKAYKEQEKVIQTLTKQHYQEEPTKEYIALKKEDLAEFFINEAKEKDFEFFNPVIDKITEIRKEFQI